MTADDKLGYLFGEISVKEYALTCIREGAFDEGCRNCDGMAEKCRCSIVNAIVKLDGVPRDNPFWRGTNNKATIGKACEFANQLLANGHFDSVYIWLLIGSAIQGAGNCLRSDCWHALHSLNELRVDWLVNCAWNTSCYWDDCNIPKLSGLLSGLGLLESAKPHLDQIRGSGEEGSDRWVDAVIEACG